MRITAGEVRVNLAELVIDTAEFKVWLVDLESKYAELLTYSDDEVVLIAGARTLRPDPARRGVPTVLHVDLPDGGERWHVLAECRRYTCRVVAYRLPPAAIPLW